jgi:hypothetical protein
VTLPHISAGVSEERIMTEPGQSDPENAPPPSVWQPPSGSQSPVGPESPSEPAFVPPAATAPHADAPPMDAVSTAPADPSPTAPMTAAPTVPAGPSTTAPVPHGTTVPGEQVPHIGPPIEPPSPQTRPEDQVVFGMESRATRRLMIFCSVVVLLVLVGGAVTLFVGHFRPDRGVTECKKVAQLLNGTSSTFSEQDYHALRDPFNASRFDDIRSSGTRLAEEIWQLVGNGRQPTAADLGVVQQIEGSYGDLVTACANHGVTVPPLPGN